jgi:two-component system osmolarity sensor histidine kinase EnvZ
MVADIEQLDAIIDKFMDYARPGEVELVPVHVATVVDKAISQFRDTQASASSASCPSTRG